MGSNMKLAIIAFFSLICLISAQTSGHTHGHNGRPGCRLTEEFGRKWRNNNDPIRYWVCDGNTAVSYICPTEYMYLDQQQACCHWAYWFWTPPFDPPTLG